MFNSNQKPQAVKQQPKRQVAPRDAAVTILTSGCHFNGKLYCRGSSRIGGRIEGQIVSEGLLIIEEEAIITAEIKADEAIIQGRIKGKLEAQGRVELCSTCWFEGDILTPSLVVHEGAQFNGRSSMRSTQKGHAKMEGIPGGNHKGDQGPDVGQIKKDKSPEVAVL